MLKLLLVGSGTGAVIRRTSLVYILTHRGIDTSKISNRRNGHPYPSYLCWYDCRFWDLRYSIIGTYKDTRPSCPGQVANFQFLLGYGVLGMDRDTVSPFFPKIIK